MILWCDGAHDPAENMRRDRCLFERASRAAGQGDAAAAEPVLRLFAFDPPGITLGYAQRPEVTLDLARCHADGVPYAVRPTGGRAIFHAREWTYSFAVPVADPEWGGTLALAYARVSAWIHASLVHLGVPAELAARARAVPPGAGEPAATAAAAGRTACFASTARHEIVLGGRKLVGSAQRRNPAALLQQGSVLLGPGHERLADYVAAGAGGPALRAALVAASAAAGEYLGGDERLDRWAGALAATAERGVRPVSAPEALQWLTPFESGSYTRPPS